MSLVVVGIATTVISGVSLGYSIISNENAKAEQKEKEKKAEEENNRLIAEAKNRERLDEEGRVRDRRRAVQRQNQVSRQAAGKGGTIATSPAGVSPLSASSPLGQLGGLPGQPGQKTILGG